MVPKNWAFLKSLCLKAFSLGLKIEDVRWRNQKIFQKTQNCNIFSPTYICYGFNDSFKKILVKNWYQRKKGDTMGVERERVLMVCWPLDELIWSVFIAMQFVHASREADWLLHLYEHITCIPRWNNLERTVSTSFQRGTHVVCL